MRALTRAAVTHIVRTALLRAGIKAPINGAQVLRHSAATAVLRNGASLAGVSAVLRHRFRYDDSTLPQGGFRAALGDRAALVGGARVPKRGKKRCETQRTAAARNPERHFLL